MSIANPPEKISPFAVFRSASFTRLWLAQLFSTIGDSFTIIASGILIYQRTGSTLSVGLLLLATSLPTLLIGLFAGVFVDRFDRKKIMIAADLSRGALIFLLPILIHYNLLWMYLVVFLSSAVSSFFLPAYDSVIPEMASDEELTAANSMISISSFGSTAIGFAASGLIAAYSIELAFYIDAVTFFISALLIAGAKIAPIKVEENTSVEVVLKNLQSGMRYLFGSQILRSLLAISGLYALMAGMVNTLLLPFATGPLNATTFEYGLQEGLTSIGYVIGSLFMARYADRRREGFWIIVGLLGMGVTTLLYSFSSTVTFAILMVTLSGFLHAPYAVAWITAMQRNTEREVRGRVFGANMTGRNVLMLFGMAAAGLADIYGARLMMQVAASVCLGIGVFAMLAPGIGRPAAEWVRSFALLRRAPQAPNSEPGRAATLDDVERLVERLPVLSILTLGERKGLVKLSRSIHAAEGVVIVRQGEASDAAYFILDGGVIVGREDGGRQRILDIHGPGDFFGEIAALTGVQRTATVVANQPSNLLYVPAAGLREMSRRPELSRLLLSKMTERLITMGMIDMPKINQLDQGVLRDLRTPELEAPLAPPA